MLRIPSTRRTAQGAQRTLQVSSARHKAASPALPAALGEEAILHLQCPKTGILQPPREPQTPGKLLILQPVLPQNKSPQLHSSSFSLPTINHCGQIQGAALQSQPREAGAPLTSHLSQDRGQWQPLGGQSGAKRKRRGRRPMEKKRA